MLTAVEVAMPKAWSYLAWIQTLTVTVDPRILETDTTLSGIQPYNFQKRIRLCL